MTSDLKSILLALWLGAALLFGAVVAPAVFSVLRSFQLANANEIAGTIVTRTLSVINVGAFVIGLLLLLMIVFARRAEKGIAFKIEVASLATLAATSAVGHWLIAAKMRALRTSMVTIDLIAPDDPRRVAFNNLHHYSVALMGIAMIAAGLAMIMGRHAAHRTLRDGGPHW